VFLCVIEFLTNITQIYSLSEHPVREMIYGHLQFEKLIAQFFKT